MLRLPGRVSKAQRGEGDRAQLAASVTTVTMADFAALGPLILARGRRGAGPVSGPWWALRPAQSGLPGRLGGRRSPTPSPSARDCADALGAEVESLELLADARITGHERAVRRAGVRAATPPGPATPHCSTCSRSARTCDAAVDARFRISTPAVLNPPTD